MERHGEIEWKSYWQAIEDRKKEKWISEFDLNKYIREMKSEK